MTYVPLSTICVCICTFKRPHLLERTLEALAKQKTDGSFAYSVVVTDNDVQQSAKPVVDEFSAKETLDVFYCVEPQQNIALARNTALRHACGDYIALIDDDELPTEQWLTNLVRLCVQSGADGVLGPVRPQFDETPPSWLIRSKLCERPEYPTGLVLHWSQTRTGNVLLRSSTLKGVDDPFRKEFGNGGEDQDFFRRMNAQGRRFIWCNEAVVFEVVPQERWTRRYMFRRALLRGQNERLLLSARSVLKSCFAIPLYALVLPLLFVVGQHLFMRYSVRLLDHAGKLFALLGLKPVGGKYLGG